MVNQAQYKELIKQLIKTIKKKYESIRGISKVLKRMLEFDENSRADFLDLE